MFNVVHVAISVSNIENSIEFYKKFGFKELKSWDAADESIKIRMLKLNEIILEIFCYKNHIELPKTATSTATDLPVLGTKHFALGVSNIEKAKRWVLENKIADDVTINVGRLGKPYFFIKDPDGILVEIIEKDIPKTDLLDNSKQEIAKIIRNASNTGFYAKNRFHSMEHIAKVVTFSYLLGKEEKLIEEEMKLLLVSAAFHDCGRNGNDGENEHAEAGAKLAGEYFTKNPTNPFNINADELPIIQVVIHYHEHKEHELGKLNKDGIEYLVKKYNAPSDKISEIEKLCMLLKDADALDRERFATYGKLDPKYLRSKSAKTPQMLKYAKEINQVVAKEILKKIYGIENIKEGIDSVKLLEELKLKKVEMLGNEFSLNIEEILDLLF